MQSERVGPLPAAKLMLASSPFACLKRRLISESALLKELRLLRERVDRVERMLEFVLDRLHTEEIGDGDRETLRRPSGSAGEARLHRSRRPLSG